MKRCARRRVIFVLASLAFATTVACGADDNGGVLPYPDSATSTSTSAPPS